MRWRVVISAIICCSLLFPSFASASQDSESQRIWSFEAEGDSNGFMMIMALEFRSVDAAWDASQQMLDDDWADRYVGSAKLSYRNPIRMWCYMYEGEPPMSNTPWESAWLFICPVDVYLYTVMVYGDTNGAAIEVTEDLIIYDDPQVPDGWIDVTEDLLG